MQHFLDWSSAAVDWTADGFELSVNVAEGATYRHATLVAEDLGALLAHKFPAAELVVLAIEPEPGDRPELTLTSQMLFSIDPVIFRREVDEIADGCANRIVAEVTRDQELGVQWLSHVRGFDG